MGHGDCWFMDAFRRGCPCMRGFQVPLQSCSGDYGVAPRYYRYLKEMSTVVYLFTGVFQTHGMKFSWSIGLL
jgi:hypothetical protein